MTAQHPAAPETETDANGLRELLAAATPGPWQHFGDHLVWPSERGPAANDPIAGVNEAHEECAALIVAAVNALPALLADLDAARERVRVVEGERDEWKSRAFAAVARAESAEAAHEAAEQHIAQLTQSRDRAEAAHERLRAGVEALAERWSGEAEAGREFNGHPLLVQCYDGHARDLARLLAGGGAR